MGAALITGPTEKLAEVSAVLRAAGHDPAGEESLDWYVHVLAARPGDAPRTSEISAVVADVEGVAPRLRPGAGVVLVTPGWDWRERSALRLLAEVTLSAGPAERPSVMVLGGLADLAGTVASGQAPSLADLDPGRGFADWREDMLTLAEESGRVYFGWTGDDGRPRVAVLAGSVMSPLRVAAGAGQACWGPGSDASGLAAALLGDALGPESRCLACDGGARGCVDCGETGLSGAVAPLAKAFLSEVLLALPAESFEMRVADVVDWACRQGPISGDRRRTPTLV